MATFTCTKCRKELATKYMHKSNVCVDCAILSQKQDGHSAYNKVQKTDAIHILRKSIINAISKTPATTYELASLLWGDAAKCFPTNYSFNWDGAWFKLNLLTQKLYADVSTYPNQFGATRDEKYDLTAVEFHSKAMEFHLSKELQCMETEADWQELFDEDLNTAIANAKKAIEEQQESEKQAQQIKNGIVIPDEFAAITPTMELDEVRLELHQKYNSNCVLLAQRDGKYILVGSSKKELSSMESAWVERQVKECIKNRDETTWQSMVGGDYMSVKIIAAGTVLVELFYKKPLVKYYELKHTLQKLAKYGSLSESEKETVKT